MYTTPDLAERGGANAYLRGCASRSALDLLANKWVCLVVGALSPGPMRFGALRRRLDGITQKMLTRTLRDLERAGVVERTVYPTTPPQVEYALTPLGESLCGLMDSILGWAEEHMEEVEAARERYDERASLPVDPLPRDTP
ncbi:helix-turn-helix domain-containing protein [Nocardiopsis sp. N85]|uniref:winged helix-turn-helix transcriptional regulator n=1 Tax=Nocardiopsis sp. N85 TaxID=3029400 RepID=UPI00237F4028|nr:helix-turn-helix domain-containing protein [Nocardiopsis sp. N85]MDE3720470.1 helix-turn-helix domain-containing protein [Nocardiopsis sp. N85]